MNASEPQRPLPPRCRRLTLGDAMILVAASGLSLALLRVVLPGTPEIFREVTLTQLVGTSPWRYPFRRTDVAVALLLKVLAILFCFVSCGAPAYLFVRLRPSSLPLRERFLQPGVVACAAMLAGHGLLEYRVVMPPGWPRLAAELTADAAIPLAWALLAWAGRWRPEPGWIERLGRLLGVGCVLFQALGTVLALWFLS